MAGFDDEHELALLEQHILELQQQEQLQEQQQQHDIFIHQQQQLAEAQEAAQHSVPAFSAAGMLDVSMAGNDTAAYGGQMNGSQSGNGSNELVLQSANVRVPPHRMAPLRDNWIDLYSPLVEQLGLQVRMNTRIKAVELRECESTLDATSLQKAVKFLEAFFLGFEVGDALAVLRLDDLYVESFNVDDVKQMIHGDHLSRAIGRIAGKDGKTKFAIENATRTRIVLADKRIHILGSFQNIKIARNAVCDLILGSPPGKVYAHLRAVSSRLKEQF